METQLLEWIEKTVYPYAKNSHEPSILKYTVDKREDEGIKAAIQQYKCFLLRKTSQNDLENVFRHEAEPSGIRTKSYGHEPFAFQTRRKTARDTRVRQRAMRKAWSSSKTNLAVTNLDRYNTTHDHHHGLFDLLHQEARTHFLPSTCDLKWDEMGYEIGGMGLRGIQLYFKNRFTFTGPHDEIAWSEAWNYMRRDTSSPDAKAIWIGFWMEDLKEKMGGDAFKVRQSFAQDPFPLMDTLVSWMNAAVPLYYVEQRPGDLVMSPSSIRGAGHLVVTVGKEATHVTWNSGTNVAAFRACLAFDQGKTPAVWYNSGLATRNVLPCLRIQERCKIDLGITSNMLPTIAADATSLDFCPVCWQMYDTVSSCLSCQNAHS